MKTLTSVLFAALLALPLVAGNPRTLTPAFYATNAHRGPSKGFVWTAPSYDRSKGIAWDGVVAWPARERSTGFLVALKSALPTVMSPTGAYHLRVAVVEAESSGFASLNRTVEFQILDGEGNIIAEAMEKALQSKRESDAQGADRIVTMFVEDLEK